MFPATTRRQQHPPPLPTSTPTARTFGPDYYSFPLPRHLRHRPRFIPPSPTRKTRPPRTPRNTKPGSAPELKKAAAEPRPPDRHLPAHSLLHREPSRGPTSTSTFPQTPLREKIPEAPARISRAIRLRRPHPTATTTRARRRSRRVHHHRPSARRFGPEPSGFRIVNIKRHAPGTRTYGRSSATSPTCTRPSSKMVNSHETE